MNQAQRVQDALRGLLAATVDSADASARPDVLVGLVGRGIQSSRTPAMHMREAARQGLDCAYILIDFDALGLDDADLGAVVDAVRVLGFSGINVTHPFKQKMIPLLDGLAEEASAIGAVNTVVFDGRATGHNTDCWGFAESFRTGMAGASARRVTQFGAGGAGAAVAYALLQLGVEEIVLIDSVPAHARSLAKRLTGIRTGIVRFSDDVAGSLGACNGIVNTTPVGMAKYPGMPFQAEFLRPHHWVADIIYFPIETELLRRAQALGCRALPGIGMAIGQAVRAFELFTGRQADSVAMAKYFEAAA